MIPISMKISGKQQMKSNDTRQKLLGAVDQLMKQYTYDSVTVRNICEIAKVSVGSFYHHFGTKEKLLSIYLAEDFEAYSKDYFANQVNLGKCNLMEKIVELFKCCAKHCRVKGYEFVSGFQSTKNKGILPSPKENYANNAVFSPIFHQALAFLAEGQRDRLVKPEADITGIAYDLCLLCHGFLYNWCVSEGSLDFEGIIERVFIPYLQVYMESEGQDMTT